MLTFKGTLNLDFKVIFTDQHVADLREAAAASDATQFLKYVQAKHPVNNDAFMAAIAKNAIRGNTRDKLIELFSGSGCGGTVSPAVVDIIEVPQDFGGSVQPVVIDRAIETPFAVPTEVLPVGLISEEI